MIQERHDGFTDRKMATGMEPSRKRDIKRNLGPSPSEGEGKPPPPPCSILPELEVGFPLKTEHIKDFYPKPFPYTQTYSAHSHHDASGGRCSTH